jgi:predicted dehydrogenase
LPISDTPEDLLAENGIDSVIICAETLYHADLVEMAAKAGKKIILQKPIATTPADADRIVDAVKKYNVPFTLAWQMRVDPHNLKVRQLLESGKFGKILMIRRRHSLSTHLWNSFEKSWHVNPTLNHSIFADDAAHPADFIYWLLGMPESVFAEIVTTSNSLITGNNAIAVFRYPDGLLAEISCTFTAVAGENTLEILCENGTIVGNYGDQVSCITPRDPGVAQLKTYLHGDDTWTKIDLPDIYAQRERIQGLAVPLAEFLNGTRPGLATAEEGRDVLKMTMACVESADEGKRVLLN